MSPATYSKGAARAGHGLAVITGPSTILFFGWILLQAFIGGW